MSPMQAKPRVTAALTAPQSIENLSGARKVSHHGGRVGTYSHHSKADLEMMGNASLYDRDFLCKSKRQTFNAAF